MKIKTEKLVDFMKILAWIVFIGLIAEVGAILISYFISANHIDGVTYKFDEPGLLELRKSNVNQFNIVVANGVIFAILKAYTAFLVVQLLTRINMKQPFEMHIAVLLEKLSYYILVLCGVAFIINRYNDYLRNKFSVSISSNSLEFIFLAGVIFIIAQIFKRGIEIQNENELTI